MTSSIIFPGPFEPDFRPMIILIIAMTFSIAYAIKKNWNDIKDDIDKEWE
jgi:hypothetical protein